MLPIDFVQTQRFEAFRNGAILFPVVNNHPIVCMKVVLPAQRGGDEVLGAAVLVPPPADGWSVGEFYSYHDQNFPEAMGGVDVATLAFEPTDLRSRDDDQRHTLGTVELYEGRGPLFVVGTNAAPGGHYDRVRVDLASGLHVPAPGRPVAALKRWSLVVRRMQETFHRFDINAGRPA